MMIRMITESGIAAILDIGELKFLETDNERLLVLSCALGRPVTLVELCRGEGSWSPGRGIL